MSNKEKLYQPANLYQTAQCYKLAFWGSPWKEAFVKDKKFYPATPELLIDANWRLQDYQRAYPMRQTADYIRAEVTKPGAVFRQIFKPNSQTVIGFGWGYSIPYADILAQDKWPQASPKDQTILSLLINRFTLRGSFWYLSEVGIRPHYQEQGLGTQIVRQLIDQAPCKQIVMRTNQDSPMVSIAKKFDFVQILGPSVDKSAPPPTPSCITNLNDPQNPNRVLFYKGPIINRPPNWWLQQASQAGLL